MNVSDWVRRARSIRRFRENHVPKRRLEDVILDPPLPP